MIHSATKPAQIPLSPILADSQSPMLAAAALAAHPIAVMPMVNRITVVRISAVRRMPENVDAPRYSVDSRRNRQNWLRTAAELKPHSWRRQAAAAASGPDFATMGHSR